MFTLLRPYCRPLVVITALGEVCEAVESPSIARDPTLGRGEEELDAPIWNPDLAFRKRTARYIPGL